MRLLTQRELAAVPHRPCILVVQARQREGRRTQQKLQQMHPAD